MAQRQDDLKAAARRERMQMVIGGILGVALIIGAVLAIVLTADNSDDENVAGTGTDEVLAPTAGIRDLEAAAKQAGCELKTGLESEGRGHDEKTFTAADYKTNPPTSGTHHPEWYQDGIYEPGNTEDLGMLVHSLEHGRINLQYKPGTPEQTVKQLEELFNENGGYHQLLHENATDMPYQVAATAWTQLIGCKTMSPAAFDALRAFRTQYTDKGPEAVP